ncbi:MAG: hypothetical protein LUD22_01980 [Coprobacillus sp.]|nr:hypothetical protein [Coprobacillus sp.]
MNGVVITTLVIACIFLALLLACVCFVLVGYFYYKKHPDKLEAKIAKCKEKCPCHHAHTVGGAAGADEETIKKVVVEEGHPYVHDQADYVIRELKKVVGSGKGGVLPAEEGGVAFVKATDKKTYTEQIEALPAAEKKGYDHLISHIKEKQGEKESLTNTSLKIKLKSYPLVKFTFKRKGLVALISVHNDALNPYQSEDSVKINNETQLLLKTKEDYDLAFELVDLAEAEIAKDLERKAAERREKRRLARLAKKEAGE